MYFATGMPLVAVHPRKDTPWEWGKGVDSFVVRLREGLLGRYLGYALTDTDSGGVLCASILVLYP